MRVALAQLNFTVGAFEANFRKIDAAARRAAAERADLLLLSELATTGYPPRDLLTHAAFVASSLEMRNRVARQVLRAMIDERLMLQEAARQNVIVQQSEVDAELTKLAERNGVTLDQIGAYLAQNGVLLEPLAEQVRATIAWSKLVSRQLRPRAVITEVRSRGRVPVLVGGSALYTRAVLDRFEFPGTDPALRASYDAELARVGPAALHARLAEVDPEAAAGILPENGRRVVRALEVVELTGRPFSASLPVLEYVDERSVQVGVRIDRPTLDARIALLVQPRSTRAKHLLGASAARRILTGRRRAKDLDTARNQLTTVVKEVERLGAGASPDLAKLRASAESLLAALPRE